MPSSFSDFSTSIQIMAVVYGSISICGIFLNSLVVLATIHTKSLHTSCGALIGFCAFCDVLHQAGQLPRLVFVFSGNLFTDGWHCNWIQFLPIFGLSAGSWAVLSIGIDRVLSAVAPHYYKNKNAPIYLGLQFLACLVYTGWQYFLMFGYIQKRLLICTPPEAFHGEAKMLWAISSCVVYVAAVVLYCTVWVVLKKKEQIRQIHRIFRSLFIVMFVVVIGWMVTMGGVVVATTFFHLDDPQMYLVHEGVGLFVNSSLVANYVVYYFTSTEYRMAFRRQMASLPCVRRRVEQEWTRKSTQSFSHN